MKRLLSELSCRNIEYICDLPLSKYCTFRVGGAATLGVFPASEEDLVFALRLLRAQDIPFLMIGNGSNVVFSDEGFSGAVVFTAQMKAFLQENCVLKADAGVSLAALANAALEHSLTGAEFLHGIPGTLGGAVFMNAGAYGGSISDICVCSRYYDTERDCILSLCGEHQAFGTRKSFYSEHPHAVILGATLALSFGNEEKIKEQMRDLAHRRRTSQPLEYPSAGSVFKRPVGHFAGKLIEDCGLKGACIGGAEVSVKHAGFIVNRGGATSDDIKRLVAHIQGTVLERTGVSLECEIRFL